MVQESLVPCHRGHHCHPDEVLANTHTELGGTGRGSRLSWLAAQSRLAVAQIHLRLVPKWARVRPEVGVEVQTPSAATDHSSGTAREGSSGKGVQKGTPRRDGTLVFCTWSLPLPGGPLQEGTAV